MGMFNAGLGAIKEPVRTVSEEPVSEEKDVPAKVAATESTKKTEPQKQPAIKTAAKSPQKKDRPATAVGAKVETPTDNKGREKKPVGRPRSRGEVNIDYKRISLAVPTDMFEKIKDQCRGNMTQFICDAIAAYLK